MLKKFGLILLAVMLVFGLVMMGCSDDDNKKNGGDDTKDPVIKTCDYCDASYDEAKGHECWCDFCEEDWDDCECDYYFSFLTVIQDGAGGVPVVADTVSTDDPWSVTWGKTMREMGWGYIGGTQLTKLKNAPNGSIILLEIDGTDEGASGMWDWGNHGAVGIGAIGNHLRVDFRAPQPYASVDKIYFPEIKLEDLYRQKGFGAATYLHANSWGRHITKTVYYGKIKEADTVLKTPALRDYDITAVLSQFLEDGDVVPVTVVPHWRMSSGAITIKYAGETAVPDEPGEYIVTFDVAAATGFNAATGLPVGTLSIRAARPQNNKLEAFLTITGITVTGLDDILNTELVAGAALNFTSFGGILRTTFDWVGANAPVWVLNDDDTFSLKVNGTDGNFGAHLALPYAVGDRVIVNMRGGTIVPANIVFNAGSGWNEIGGAVWGVAANTTYANRTGTINAAAVTYGGVRISANYGQGVDPTPNSYFLIDSITVER